MSRFLLPNTALLLSALAFSTSARAEDVSATTASTGSLPPAEDGTLEAPAESEPGDPPPDSTAEAPEAAAVPPAPTAAAEVPCEESPAPLSSVEADPDAVFRAYAAMAKQERRRRYAGAVAGVAGGGAAIAVGAILKSEEDINPGPFYVIGGLAAGFSLLGAIIPSPIEIQAKKLGAEEPGHTADEARALVRSWERAADDARRWRIRSSIGGLVVGAAATGVGIAFLSGATDLSRDDRVLWGSVLLGSGVALLGGSGASLFIESPVEQSYHFFEASQPKPGKNVAVGIRPFGLGLAAGGTF